MFKTIALILSINIILSADPILFDNKILNENNSSKNSYHIEKYHKTFGRYNPLYNKCIKPVDNNLTLSNIYSYINKK
jgi:hypothetical protein